MLNKQEFSDYINKIIKINENGIKQKRKKLEAFTKEEYFIREFHLELSDFEKTQKDSSLDNFKILNDKIVKDILSFNPYDVNENIVKVRAHVEYIKKYKENLNFVSAQINQILNKWNSFLSKNEKFVNSQLNINFNNLLNEIEETMSSSGITNISSISFQLENLNDKVDKNLGLIGKINEYKNFYMFQGEEAKEIEKNILDLLDIKEDKKEGDFMDEGKILIRIIENKIKESKTKTLGIPVIVAQNVKDKNIKRYTLKFKDFILKEDPFFNSKGIKFLDTNDYFYLKGVPQNGIFKGKDIIENLSVDNNYAKSVNEYISAASKNFYILIGIFVFLGFTSIAIQNIIVSILFTAFIVGGYYLFSVHLNALKTNIEEKYNIPNMFIFHSLNMVIYDKGYDVDTSEFIDWILTRLDNTIYNQENIKWSKLKWLEN